MRIGMIKKYHLKKEFQFSQNYLYFWDQYEKSIYFLMNAYKYNEYLKHENIENLKGLEIELVDRWNLGDLLIFDRSNLHCSSSNIKNKKIGLTTFTKK